MTEVNTPLRKFQELKITFLLALPSYNAITPNNGSTSRSSLESKWRRLTKEKLKTTKQSQRNITICYIKQKLITSWRGKCRRSPSRFDMMLGIFDNNAMRFFGQTRAAICSRWLFNYFSITSHTLTVTYNTESSAWRVISHDFKFLSIPFTSSVKSNGRSMDPCGTPYEIALTSLWETSLNIHFENRSRKNEQNKIKVLEFYWFYQNPLSKMLLRNGSWSAMDEQLLLKKTPKTR